MLHTRTILVIFFLLLTFTWLSSSGLLKKVVSSESKGVPSAELTFLKLKGKVATVKEYIREKGFNRRICFLVDMSLPSGQPRFFVYDLLKDTLQNKGLVTHGRCNEAWLEGRKYGNTVGCGCTSLGRYRVGKSYTGKFGLAFKLHGLDKTNDQAYERFVVLHSHECVPETAVRDEICQSDGCPTVSPGFLSQLDPMIKRSSRPVLLWIFE